MPEWVAPVAFAAAVFIVGIVLLAKVRETKRMEKVAKSTWGDHPHAPDA
jgi:hypothetical protein